ncbi:MAG: hypothetical protein U0V73_04000 [Acidimicrobiia bacterium]
MKRIESSHSIWIFDTGRMRFRRVPKDADVDAPSLDSDWERYYALEIDPDSGSFTVTLNAEGTRLLRSWSDGALPADVVDATADRTAELSLETIDRPGLG